MNKKEELIKALKGAFGKDAEEGAEPEYVFEEIMVSNVRASRLISLKAKDVRTPEEAEDMLLVNGLSRFFQKENTEDTRNADKMLRELCRQAQQDEDIYEAILELARDIALRLNGTGENSAQRGLLAVYATDRIKRLYEGRTEI